MFIIYIKYIENMDGKDNTCYLFFLASQYRSFLKRFLRQPIEWVESMRKMLVTHTAVCTQEDAYVMQVQAGRQSCPVVMRTTATAAFQHYGKNFVASFHCASFTWIPLLFRRISFILFFYITLAALLLSVLLERSWFCVNFFTKRLQPHLRRCRNEKNPLQIHCFPVVNQVFAHRIIHHSCMVARSNLIQ